MVGSSIRPTKALQVTFRKASFVEGVGWSVESSHCEGICDARWYAEGGRSASVLEGEHGFDSEGGGEGVGDKLVKFEVVGGAGVNDLYALESGKSVHGRIRILDQLRSRRIHTTIPHEVVTASYRYDACWCP